MKKRILSIILVVIISVICLASCNIGGADGGESDGGGGQKTYVTVSVSEGEHYSVTSENPKSVEKGSDAVFSIEIDEGYEYSGCSVSGASFDNGNLTIPGVLYPTTVIIETNMKIVIGPSDSEEDETPEDDEGNGENGSSDNDGGSDTDEEPLPKLKTVELFAEEREGEHFICWTLDKAAEFGGEVISEETSVTLEIPADSEAVANYAPDGLFVILYRTNGGVTKDGQDYYYQTFSSENYKLPNTISQDGTFERDGYVLMRYTENGDGSGDYTTLGGKILTSDNGFVELWLKWGKVTTSGFGMTIYENDDGEEVVSINSYSGAAKNVVIPEEVEITSGEEAKRYKVEKISSFAFENLLIESVVLPSTIVTVENNAFYNCTKLKELTLHDNVWQITDSSFYGCTSLTTCYLNAGRAPTHAGSGEGLHVVKYEALRMAAKRNEKKIVVVSGSSSVYGFYAERMTEAFGGEYTAINCGTNASASTYFYVNAYMRFFGEGDIVIQAPETTSAAQLGANEIVWRVLRECECAYEIFSFVNMNEFVGFFNALSEFNQTVRNTMEDSSYEAWRGNYNEYGDLTVNVDKFDYKTSSPGAAKVYNKSLLTDGRIRNLNTLNARLNERGATMYMSFAPVNYEYCNKDYLTEKNVSEYVAYLEAKLDYDVISNPLDYVLEEKYFNNSDYHPGITGANIRTDMLIADLKAKLAEDGIWADSE